MQMSLLATFEGRLLGSEKFILDSLLSNKTELERQVDSCAKDNVNKSCEFWS